MFSTICFSGFISFLQTAIFAVGYISGGTVFPEPLSSEEEKNALIKLSQGDEEARNLLIERNLRLVAHVSKKYSTTNIDQDDLISIGTIGLIKAINSFDNSKNIRLATYAARCIENEILMHYRSNKKHLNNVSLNDSIGFDKDGNEINLIDVLKCDNEDIADMIDTQNKIDLLLKYLDTLSKREKEIIIKRYGLYNTREMTQKEISKEMKISRSYVSRIEKRAITKIFREFIKNKKI